MKEDDLQKWVGNCQTLTDTIGSFPANALAATLDRDDPPYENGSALPPIWHWLHFLPIFKKSNTGFDGHEALGGFFPPIPLPRRMWAGSRLTFHSDLSIGDTLQKKSTLKSVKSKTGKSGALVFVTVRHQVFDAETLLLDEEQDIVYREKPDPNAPVVVPSPAPEASSFSRKIDPDPVLLFRYSALTFNGHRIHYDQPFCVESEGYQGLVVHGPLLATLLLDLLRREFPNAKVLKFDFRAVSTIYDTETFTIHGAAGPKANSFHLWAKRQDGALAMQAEATIQ